MNITEHRHVIIWSRRTNAETGVNSTRHVKRSVATRASALKTGAAATTPTHDTQQLPASSRHLLNTDNWLTHGFAAKVHFGNPQRTGYVCPAAIISWLHSSTVSAVWTQATVNCTRRWQRTATTRPRSYWDFWHTITHLQCHQSHGLHYITII